ncbi:MAG TPA: DUF3298 and DUF4163 domain-containing protein [Flavobacteriaceae bacterium]
MKKILLFSILVILTSCVKEISFEFEETAIIKKDPVSIEVIYPKLNDASDITSKINKAIESAIAEHIVFFEEDTDRLTLNDAISQFENRFISFKNDFEADAAPWEVTINSEVVFQSVYVITISIDSYTFTGGAHGNSVITLLNFDPKTGDLYSQDDVLKPSKDFISMVEQYFKTETATKTTDSSENYFFGEDFKLPENIGFNDDGVIFLYNTYELASYAEGITEFTIPYSEISKFIKINH